MPTSKTLALASAMILPAFAMVDGFTIPERGGKYPWLTMNQGQTAVYEVTDEKMRNRIIRSATSVAKRHGRRFATRQLPAGTKVGEKVYPNGALAIQFVGLREKSVKKKAVKKASAKVAA